MVKPRSKKPAPGRPIEHDRPLWVLTDKMIPRLVAVSGKAPVLLDDVVYFAREGDRRWRPIGELLEEKGERT